MASYQQLQKYDGSLAGPQDNFARQLSGEPRYDGIEYNWEVPDNLVIGSPGGVSTIHHHYTGGFNGPGNSSADLFAGQAQRYNSGIYGNLYQTGQEAGQFMGYYPAAPDYQFWQNGEPQQYSYTQSQSATWDPSMKIYGGPGSYESFPDQKKSLTTQHPGGIERYTDSGLYPLSEGYELDDDFEMIEPIDLDSNLQQDISQMVDHTKDSNLLVIPRLSPWILFLFLIFAFIAFDFWANAANLFIEQKFHGGGKPSWQRALLYAIIVTILFGFILWATDIPVTDFEKL